MPKILIVDDEFHNRDIVKVRLEQTGYEVCEAVNGEEGFQAALRHRPDLVLLDVMLPKLDGHKVCRMLKTNPQTKDIPVIMLTAQNQQMDELLGFDSGADDYLVKPVDHARLLEVIAGHISPQPKGSCPL